MKKNCHRVHFAVPTEQRVKVKVKESEKIDRYLDFTGDLKKLGKLKGDSDTNFSVDALGTVF